MAHSVFITGANRGIGLSLTELYLERGWNVLATSRNVTDSDELQALRARYSSLSLHELDVTDYAKIALLAQSLPPIDLLINNAGYYGPKGYGFGNTDVDEWRKVLEINTIAPLKLVETLYPQLQQGQLKKNRLHLFKSREYDGEYIGWRLYLSLVKGGTQFRSQKFKQ